MDKVAGVYKSVQWINSLFEKNEKPQFLLDPLTTIVKLAMLKYKTPCTKIRIANNKLSYSEPSMLQGVSRWMMGDSRNNHHFLYLPVLFFCHLKYTTCKLETDGNLDQSVASSLHKVIDIYNKLAIDGLQMLKSTYLDSKNDLVINCLDLYLLMLSSENESSIKQRYEKINSTTKNIYDEFLKCWNKNNIEVLTNLFGELEMKHDDNSFIMKTLEGMENYLEAINYKIDKLRCP